MPAMHAEPRRGIVSRSVRPYQVSNSFLFKSERWEARTKRVLNPEFGEGEDRVADLSAEWPRFRRGRGLKGHQSFQLKRDLRTWPHLGSEFVTFRGCLCCVFSGDQHCSVRREAYFVWEGEQAYVSAFACRAKAVYRKASPSMAELTVHAKNSEQERLGHHATGQELCHGHN